MFHKTIHLKRMEDVRYGQTEIAAQKTFLQITQLLDKHGADKIATATMRDGNESLQRLAFEIDGKGYVVDVPRVYVNGIYKEKIGVRIVFRFLETLLELVKNRIVDIDFLMLGSRVVETPDGPMTLADAARTLPPGSLFQAMDRPKELREGED